MGGSSSKQINNHNIDKIESFIKGDENETMYKDKKEQNEIINENVINSNKKSNKSKFNNLLKQTDDISNDIEEFTLDKNGLLIKEKDIINLSIAPKNQLEKEKSEDTPLLTYNDIIIKEEEIIIPFTEKESLKIITIFYDDFIEILYCFNSRKNFIALAKSLNEKYLYKLDVKKFPNTKESQAFLLSLKYASIIIVCFIFLVKDFHLFKNSAQKIKENVEQFIFTSLDNIDRTVVFSLKIINFAQRYRKIKKNYFGCVNSIVKTLFKNEASYKNILNCLEQILSKINTDSTKDIITKINESVLFYHNASSIKSNSSNINNNDDNNINDKIENKIYTFRSVKKKVIRNARSSAKIKKNRISINMLDKNKTEEHINNNNKNENKNNEAICAPFIKEELDKKFCLVLDIDETLSHLIKLPFGVYFLVRPGVIDMLKELYCYYEIDIFTAALKHYADNIVNKLDKDNIYISHRLYRSHCTYEDGKIVKNLSLLGRDLNKIVFVDDIKSNAKYNMKNLVLVSKWIDNIYDDEIIKLKNKLKFIALCGKYDEDITKGLLEEKLSVEI
jgi:hypothetical protein